MADTRTTSRRSVLKVGLLGSAMLAAGGVGLGLWPGAHQTPPGWLQALTPASWSVAGAVARRMCPASRTGLPSADTVDVATRMDAVLGRMHPADAAEVHQALLLLENALAGLLLDGRPVPFTRADGPTQDAALAAWRDSRLPLRRKAYKAVRNLVMSSYWSHPDTYAGAGYPGPPDFGQARAPADDLDALVEEGRRRMAGQDVPEGQPALDPVEDAEQPG
ncbi:MAG: hypothetical protein H6742_09360 [Alphaproteobacteria bacterium]|nr:hypothetical protein [Alphaproteobacteria bacterium]